MKYYRITCSTDPYHSSGHKRYKGHEILKKDGATPVCWVHDDNSGYGYSLAEARKILHSYATEDWLQSGEKNYHKYFSPYYQSDVWTYHIEEFIPKNSKEHLEQWLRNNAESGNSVYAFINGAGLSLVRPESIGSLITLIHDPAYSNTVRYLEPGQEPEDFAETMLEKDYKCTDSFAYLKHNNGFNKENMNIYIQFWTIDN